MEIDDVYGVSSLARNASGPSNWRKDGDEVFSLPSRRTHEDDEAALQWTALEKLPTYSRLRKGLLASSHGEAVEIDVYKLGLKEKKDLIERLVNDAEEDHENFLLKLKSRIDGVGIQLPTIEVRFEHLNVEGEAYMGNRAVATFLNFFINIFESFLSCFLIIPKRKKKLSILRDVSGIIKPKRMTLLLGPPNSGKTTLLLALSGKLDPHLKLSGRVTYNGHGMREFVPERTASYISQHDVHLGEMTVRETLAFSVRCQGVGSRYDMLEELARREKEANIKPDLDIDVYMKATATGRQDNVMTDYMMKILGLEICADTMVGDGMLRGISGGQRKRVTTGEMLVGPANVLFMDEISTGLDSSTTYQIVNSLKHYVHILDVTAVISLLQPAPETYDLFDDVILLSEGHIVYQGPREHVLEFFEAMGFKCPERKSVADFLQEVTSRKDQMQYWARKDDPYSFVTVKEFAEGFLSFHVGQRLRDELATPFDKSKSHPAALSTKTYGVNKKELLKACFSREFLLMKRNSFPYIFKFVQLIILALVASTLFLRTEMHHNSIDDGRVYTGALFFSMIMVMFNGKFELPMTIVQLPVFYKQRDLHFFPAWAYAIPTLILKIPITVLEAVVWVSITYYSIGFDPNVGRLFKQYLVLSFMSLMTSGLFRFVASVSRTMINANTFGSFAMILLFALGGFVLTRDEIKKWWIWGYWISPLMYCQNAIAVNEFLGKSWSHVPPNSTESLGLAVLKSGGFFPYAYWYWLGLGVIIGFMFFFNIGFTLALTYLNPIGKPQSLKSQEDENSHQTQTVALNDLTNKKRGMILPFEPHSITFKDITYSVDMPKEMKNQGAFEDKLVLLKSLSGTFRPGVLTALMGVSGAGKTTLMDVLAGRKTGGYVEGDIRISGYPKKQETFARISGYCEQNDIHSPHVTVYESLVYSAWLRLPAEVDFKTRMMFVEEVMELVELNPLRQALVGLPGVNGLSTEQRKRLTIAVELVANPSIIFMDEPTSGLDARAAAIVMRTVRNTVDTGRTVVCTIHQPSIDIFEAFDELFLMKRGGEEIYVGPLGHNSCHLIQYFEGIDGISKIKDGCNPATWMLEVTSSAQKLALNIDFAQIYKKSELYRRNIELIKELSTPAPGSKDLHFPTTYSQSFLTQCLACLWKQHWSYWRNPSYTAVRFLFSILAGLMFGTMFWGVGAKRDKKQNVLNAMGSMYSSVPFLGFQNCSSVQPVVAIERTVFYRERAAGMYSVFPYTFAQVIIEIPYIVAQTVAFCVIAYAMIGFEWTFAKFFWYLFFTFFALSYFTFYGMMSVAMTPNLHVATIVSAAFSGMWSLFCGFIIPRSRIPIWWRWYYWLCPTAWTLYGLISAQYGDIKDVLESGETVEEFVSRFLGFRHDFLGVVAAMHVCFVVLFIFIFAFSIRAFNFQKR
ncbi:hypothetical protein UlMin_016290 [Ulmus minor]